MTVQQVVPVNYWDPYLCKTYIYIYIYKVLGTSYVPFPAVMYKATYLIVSCEQ